MKISTYLILIISILLVIFNYSDINKDIVWLLIFWGYAFGSIFVGIRITIVKTGERLYLKVAPTGSQDKIKVWSDVKTGLMWEVKQDDIVDKKLSWKEAKDWVKYLNDTNYAGFNDWQLPTKFQLLSIWNEKNSDDLYWSVTPNSEEFNKGPESIDFGNGPIYTLRSLKYHVRCLRVQI